MAMGTRPDPNPWIRIRFHGSGSKKYRPIGSGSDSDPVKFHGSGSRFEKNTQTQTRRFGGPVLIFFFISKIY